MSSSLRVAPNSELLCWLFRQDANHNMRSEIVTSAKPTKNIALGTNCRPGIDHDSMKEIREESAGISRKNIVT